MLPHPPKSSPAPRIRSHPLPRWWLFGLPILLLFLFTTPVSGQQPPLRLGDNLLVTNGSYPLDLLEQDSLVVHVTECRDHGWLCGNSFCSSFSQCAELSEGGVPITNACAPRQIGSQPGDIVGPRFRVVLGPEELSAGPKELRLWDIDNNANADMMLSVQSVVAPVGADTLLRGETRLSSIARCGQLDTYRVFAEQGETVRIEMFDVLGSLRPRLDLFDVDGRLAARGLDGGDRRDALRSWPVHAARVQRFIRDGGLRALLRKQRHVFGLFGPPAGVGAGSVYG